MNRDETKDRLKTYLPNYVKSITASSRGRNMYVCPIPKCGSGTGDNKTGAFSIMKDGIRWKCFSCDKSGDIFDLIGIVEGITDYDEQFKRAVELYGTNIDDNSAAQGKRAEGEQDTHVCIHTENTHKTYTQAEQEETETDFSDFFLQAHSRIKEIDYPQQRGLSEAIIDRFNLGYVENWRHPKAPETVPTSPRLIIPTSQYSYTARNISANIRTEEQQYKKQAVGHKHIFNQTALKSAKKPIFVVEGELDALSIIEVGGEAVALSSTSQRRAFVESLKAEKPCQPLIIALDNDAAGEKTATALLEDLQGLKIPCYRFNIAGEYEDANDMLQHDRAALAQAVAEAESIQDEAERIKRDSYLKTSTAYHIQSFINGISDSVNTPYTPTGFKKLDTALDGGLYEGLYIVGAISSLGKTTIVTQIADQIAQAGGDVLIFSLEMARAEIMAKSISRLTAQNVLTNGGDMKHAKTTRGITTGTRYKYYSSAERELIEKSIASYNQYAKHVYISEGTGDIGLEQIRDTVAQHIRYTGNKPVVIIDYLQIIAPYSERATDKQNTDKAVLELKRISRDYKLPVFCISSFNRGGYHTPVTMESFKESGAIEYSSDVLIGLQLKGVGSTGFNVDEAKKRNPREIELVILKNRNGGTGDIIGYKYYPLFNYFDEMQQ